MKTFITILLILTASTLNAGHPEKWYQQKWCDEAKGQTEVVLPDRARCDCLTATHAIEFDFSYKWAEAIGQALYYGAVTGKQPGIVLIVGPNDQKYLDRIQAVISAYCVPITVWTMEK